MTAEQKYPQSLISRGSRRQSKSLTVREAVEIRLGGQGRVRFHCLTANCACCRIRVEWCRRRCRLQSLICRWISSSLDPSAPLALSSQGLELPSCTWQRGKRCTVKFDPWYFYLEQLTKVLYICLQPLAKSFENKLIREEESQQNEITTATYLTAWELA